MLLKMGGDGMNPHLSLCVSAAANSKHITLLKLAHICSTKKKKKKKKKKITFARTACLI
jgi:hypothetical protein